MATSFEDLVRQTEAAMESVRNARQEALDKRKELDQEIAKFEQQLASLQAAVAALQGKQPVSPEGERKRRGPAPGTGRVPRGENRAKVLEIVKAHPDGIARGEIMKQLGGAKVDNILQALKKENAIGSRGEGRSSIYVPA